ncbi:sterile alpha motif domain-containing protein 1-like [Paramormyrops kingsleyae]|uniref:sterile alpha motif domain-containing protein 1-like n=1 Tax=Paramormyrops kingsleyae TaxID=1676925 RepID=UPI003B972D05
MSEPRYRDWILETIDSLRSRKARPDLERICRMVRRRHGSEPDRTRSELEKLIQEQTVLKVSYKGSISYRNAAKVQRKSRKRAEVATGGTVKVQTKHADWNNGDSAQIAAAQPRTGDTEPAEASQRCDPKASKTPLTPERDQAILTPSSENHCIGCGAEVCRNKACCSAGGSGQRESAPKDKLPQTKLSASTLDDETIKNNGSDSSGKKKDDRGMESASSERGYYGSNKIKTCGSADAHSKLRHKQKPPIKPKLRVRTKRNRTDSNSLDLGDRLVASVRSLAERKRGSVASTGPSPLGLKEILGFLSSQGRMSQEKLTRSKVKVVLEREVARGRLRRTRFGNITLPIRRVGAKASARHPKSALVERHITEREGEKELVAMETDVCEEEEEEDKEEKAEPRRDSTVLPEEQDMRLTEQGENDRHSVTMAVPPPADCVSPDPPIRESVTDETADVSHQSVLLNGSSLPSGVTSPEGMPAPPPTGHTAVKQEECEPERCPSVSCPETCPEPKQEAGNPDYSEMQPQVTCPSIKREVAEEQPIAQECAVTPHQLISDAAGVQDQVMSSEEAGKTPFISADAYPGCKADVSATSCLLTPTDSPRGLGMAEEPHRMSKGVYLRMRQDPVQWSVEDVASYFSAAGFPEQAAAFRSQEIDGKALLLMQRSDVLTGLSIRLGPALKIYEFHVKVLQNTHFEDDSGLC